jgi:CRP-like cAMP-binding protein
LPARCYRRSGLYQLLALEPDSIARSYARAEREATFNLLHAGDIFGEITLLDGQPCTANAIESRQAACPPCNTLAYS